MSERGRTFFDWNAGAPLLPDAREAMVATFDLAGNASSVHREGRETRRIIEDARRDLAALVGADPRCLAFTGGGTEANASVLVPEVDDGTGRGSATRLLVSAVEHPSVMAGGRFPREAVETIPVDANGIVDLDRLEARLAALAAAGERALVSVMAANNETGVVEPVEAVAAIARRHGHLSHTDAAQVAGRLPIDIAALGVDFMTLSVHKFGAPRGVGAVVKASAAHAWRPLVTGGGQEWRARAGTENVAAIAGTGAAARVAMTPAARAGWVETACLRDHLTGSLEQLEFEATVFGAGVNRLPNTVAFAAAGVPAETLLIALDLDGFAVSSGSACSSGKVARSHVLEAMGVDEPLAKGAIRVSLGPTSTRDEVDRFLAALERAVARFRRSRAKSAA